MKRKTELNWLTFLTSRMVFPYETWNGSSRITRRNTTQLSRRTMVNFSLYIARTSRAWMGTVKNYSTLSVELKNLHTQFPEHLMKFTQP